MGGGNLEYHLFSLPFGIQILHTKKKRLKSSIPHSICKPSNSPYKIILYDVEKSKKCRFTLKVTPSPPQILILSKLPDHQHKNSAITKNTSLLFLHLAVFWEMSPTKIHSYRNVRTPGGNCHAGLVWFGLLLQLLSRLRCCCVQDCIYGVSSLIRC